MFRALRFGAIAQLGERCVRNAEVRGSIPRCSTNETAFSAVSSSRRSAPGLTRPQAVTRLTEWASEDFTDFSLAGPIENLAISPEEAADRLAIRELIEAYAHCADRRDAKGQMALFTLDTHFVVYMNANDAKPSQELYSRDALAPVLRTEYVHADGRPRHR